MDGKELNFGQALELLKEGKKVSRKQFGPNITVMAQIPDTNSKMTLPYLYMIKAGSISEDGTSKPATLFPVSFSCESIFADDWYVIE